MKQLLEALELALEALEMVVVDVKTTPTAYETYRQAITAIKQARSAPVQEPVAWGNLANWCLDSDRVLITDKTEAEKYHRDVYDLTPLYTTPPAAQRKPLTLGQKQRLWSSVGDKPTLKDRVNAYGLAIEAAHGITAIKQARSAPVQEPVAVVDANDEGYWADILPDRTVKVGQFLYSTPPAAPVQSAERGEPVAWIFKPNRELLWPNEVERKNPLELNEYAPLYTTPPAAQRQWVGLNWEDMPDIRAGDHAFLSGAQWAEAKLKEKNNG